MIFTKTDIQNQNKVFRLNLINSITGIKPGNLVGTKSAAHGENLAIISSVVHLGSNPALLGMVMRPSDSVPRHSLSNIEENGYYTINHIPLGLQENAHYTSAKFDIGISEFEKCKLTPSYCEGFTAPFVDESPLKIGLKLKEALDIKSNGTKLIIGEVELIKIENQEALSDKGYLDLEQLNSLGISGLNSYYKLKKIGSFPYARINEIPEF